MAAVFHDFSERVQKLVWKQEGTKFTTYPTGLVRMLFFLDLVDRIIHYLLELVIL